MSTLTVLLGVLAAGIAQPPPPEGVARLTRGLFIEQVTRGGRELLRTDPIAWAMAAGTFAEPAEGATVSVGENDRAWRTVEADAEGRFEASAGRGGYAYFVVESAADRTQILDATGHTMVYVAGEPRMGDPYGNGATRLPVRLRAGATPMLFSMAGRGAFAAALRPARNGVELGLHDVTAPDLVLGQTQTVRLGIVLLNASDAPTAPVLQARIEGRHEWTACRVPGLAPLTARKVPVTLPWPVEGVGESMRVDFRVAATPGGPTDSGSIDLRVRAPHQSRKITFESAIDGSIQYYAVLPPVSGGPSPPGIVLSLHGAGVEAIGQADSYAPKPGLLIVCPTNRRPFGFDWEDWGRTDALEVLAQASAAFEVDRSRTYLTGHSMGGHGTWQLGVHFPDRFAAIAPSAGWCSFDTYGGRRNRTEGGPDDPVRAMLRRATSWSDTAALVRNLENTGVFILHGDADDNVPVSEARGMKDLLAAFHTDWRMHEEPGAGHWWDGGDWGSWPGTSCVDFPPIFELFARRRLPRSADVMRVRFRTSSPAASHSVHWARIVRQQRTMDVSEIDLRLDPAGRRLTGSTSNVDTLAIDAPSMAGTGDVTIELDGGSFTATPADPGALLLTRTPDGWATAPAPAAGKTGDAIGPFKQAFGERFALVYGTRGTPEENAWAFARARFDAEQWQYRGNGQAPVVADTEWLAGTPEGNAVLYGNAETNAAWPPLLGSAPVHVARTGVRIGDRGFSGDDLGVLFVYPDARGDRLVGVIGGTGLEGARATDRLPIFTSGVGIPDLVVLRAAAVRDGYNATELAGFFGPDWSVERGDFASPAR